MFQAHAGEGGWDDGHNKGEDREGLTEKLPRT